MHRFPIFIGLMLITAFAGAEADPLASLKKGQPREVVALIDRLVGCNHWGGEEPYDTDRKEEIAKALKELRCDAVEKDEAIALKRYAKKLSVLDALKQARDWNY